MARKSHTLFTCQQCGAMYKNWTGRCNKCGAWSSLIQQFDEDSRDEKSAIGRGQMSGKSLEFVSIKDLEVSDENPAFLPVSKIWMWYSEAEFCSAPSPY